MRFYITTPIYYVNDVPHLGTAYTTIAADVLARHHRQRGDDTHFLTGLDEHGLKVERAAQELGESTAAYVERMAAPFRETWAALDVSYDDFIRTTEVRHKERVGRLWSRVRKSGDIYEGVYEDWYCVACEAYYTQKDLGEGNVCPVHGRPVERLKEPSYFFRLSAYEARLLAHYDAHPEFVAPESRMNEVKAFVKGGLRDLSISRTTFTWGVPVPDDPRHIMYVWFDALANYLTALGDEGGPAWRFWPPTLQLVGKDILRFHAVYWPAFLMSAGLEVPHRIFAHGWLTVNGQKMSKSLRNVVEPRALAREYGADAVRFYLMREIAFGQDGDFSHDALVARWNSDLADNVGNLANRTISLARKLLGGRIPARPPAAADPVLEQAFGEALPKIEAALEAAMPHRALDEILALGRLGNLHVDRRAPWSLAKDGKKAELEACLWNVLELCRVIAVMLAPFVPSHARGLLGQLGHSVDPGHEPRWPRWGELAAGHELAAPAPAFPKFAPERSAEILSRLGVTPPGAPLTAPLPASPEAPAAPGTARIAYEDFARVELRAGEIVSAERVPKSDKLLRLQVNVGEAAPRQVVAGIGKAYAPEALLGKRVAVVCNLAPAKLMGLVSEGMLLAAGEPGTLKLVAFDGDVAVGTRIK
ncbi:MAG: methionine--tRNA ligase [Deltaproteobacteria bacterium]|nr:methionine--tRNA ligase [Deltaproteobacteria bacterium]